jgi:hypothetical protein
MRFLKPLVSVAFTGVHNFMHVCDAVAARANSEVVIDSSKSILGAIQLYLEAPENVRLILLTRDGRGVLWSNIKRGGSKDQTIKNWKRQYTRAIELIDKHVTQSHVLRVRYEELTADPKQVLAAVCDFAGVEFESAMLDYRQKTHHIVNGNRMRLHATSAIKPDDEWVRKLSTADLEQFERKAGSVNRMLGYV